MPCSDHGPALVSVIVPSFNEAKTLPHIISALLDESLLDQIIVVDDGSTDGTQQALREFAESPRVTLVSHDRNQGKGAAIRTGLALVQGRFCVVQDADLEYHPRDLVRLLQPLLHGEAHVVYGSRTRPQLIPSQSRWFARGVRVLNFMVLALYGIRIADEATCYKMFPTALVRAMDLQCQRFEFCPEVTAKFCRLGIPILELPIDYSPRSIADGKKIRLRDAVEAAWVLLYWRFARLPAAAYSTYDDIQRRSHVSLTLTESLPLVSSSSTVEARL